MLCWWVQQEKEKVAFAGGLQASLKCGKVQASRNVELRKRGRGVQNRLYVLGLFVALGTRFETLLTTSYKLAKAPQCVLI